MLVELNKLFGTGRGLMLVEHEAEGEPSLVLMHFVSEFVKQGANVVFISLNQSEEMIRTSCGKLAIRLDPKLFHFISWRAVLELGNSGDLEERILNAINPALKSVILVDNALAFRSISSDPVEVIVFCQKLRRRLLKESLVVLASPDPSIFSGFENIASAYFRLKLVNKGTGQNVTGVLEVKHHPTPFDAILQQHVYHYLLGERSFKLFLPGATHFLIVVHLAIMGLQSPVMASGNNQVPDKFFGTFKLEKSENFDEFLSAKGVNWFLRKMIQMSSITKIFQKSTEQQGRYNAINLSRKANTEYKNWALNEPFEALGLDSTKHKITFGLQDDGSTLTEHHVRLEQGGEETYYYTRENDYLILRMEHAGITCRRWFKTQENK
ncbi:hypothetical protein FO519_000835 [Halicephalobus sp. NKZ332]|nr:hypothetical protein FO519_000835 [Halicephalobus sp. NKZ332]